MPEAMKEDLNGIYPRRLYRRKQCSRQELLREIAISLAASKGVTW